MRWLLTMIVITTRTVIIVLLGCLPLRVFLVFHPTILKPDFYLSGRHNQNQLKNISKNLSFENNKGKGRYLFSLPSVKLANNHRNKKNECLIKKEITLELWRNRNFFLFKLCLSWESRSKVSWTRKICKNYNGLRP